MSTIVLLRDASIADCAVSFCVASLFVYKRVWTKFCLLFAFVGIHALSGAILVPLLFFRRDLGVSLPTAFNTYFFTSWSSGVIEALLLIGIIYHAYREAMRPLQGLQRIGKVIFRWVAFVSIAVSVAIAAGPHVAAAGYIARVAAMIGQVQQGVFVLTLCLLLFVCFAIRPLGLTFRSRIFGVALGLGVTAATCLVQAAWISTVGAQSLYSPIYLVSTVGSLVSVCIWGTYFLLPEPERKMILLPTTSPFFTWNRISEALGDEPGFVVVAGFKPSMLAAAELKVLSATSHKQDRLVSSTESLPQPEMKQIAVSQ